MARCSDSTPPSAEGIDNAAGAQDVREQLAAGLAGSLERALASYRRFSACCDADDPKSYVAHQSGCRAALAHIHLLIKLADWAGSDRAADHANTGDADLDRLLNEARLALATDDDEENQN